MMRKQECHDRCQACLYYIVLYDVLGTPYYPTHATTIELHGPAPSLTQTGFLSPSPAILYYIVGIIVIIMRQTPLSMDHLLDRTSALNAYQECMYSVLYIIQTLERRYPLSNTVTPLSYPIQSQSTRAQRYIIGTLFIGASVAEQTGKKL